MKKTIAPRSYDCLFSIKTDCGEWYREICKSNPTDYSCSSRSPEMKGYPRYNEWKPLTMKTFWLFWDGKIIPRGKKII